MSLISSSRDADYVHSIDSRRIKKLDLFKLKFIRHIEGTYATGYNDEDQEDYYEKREVTIQVVCPGGWGGINEVVKYIQDSFFFPYDSSCTGTELVSIEKTESDILMVDPAKLNELRDWNEEYAIKHKRKVKQAQKDFATPVTPEELAAL